LVVVGCRVEHYNHEKVTRPLVFEETSILDRGRETEIEIE
jgi:hypothetical protein